MADGLQTMCQASDILGFHLLEIEQLSDMCISSREIVNDQINISISFFLEMEITAAGHIKWKFGKNISCVKAFCWYVDNCTYNQICLGQVGS